MLLPHGGRGASFLPERAETRTIVERVSRSGERDNLYRVHRVSLSDGGYRTACGAAKVPAFRRAEQGCAAKGVAIWGKEVYDRGAKLHKVHWKVGKEQR